MSSPFLPASRLASLVDLGGGGGAAYRSLADQIRRLIVDGRIVLGTRLPSERDLTAALGVSRTTVTNGYAVLREAGYLTSRRGSGSLASLPEGSVRRGTGGLIPADASGHARPDLIDLTCASTRAPQGMSQAYEAALADLPGYLAGAGYFTLGLPELRTAIARRFTERGLPTTADEILVTSGALAGMAVASRGLLTPGSRVLIETPTYPNAADALRRSGIRLSTTPVTSQGWDIDDLCRQVRRDQPRAALLIPDFHNPTGALMEEADRYTVAAALARSGTIALIDETVAELHLDDSASPMRPFGAFSRDTVTVGSASKTHWGGLRIGWVRARRGLMDRLIKARVTLDLGAPVVEQLVLLHLIRNDHALLAQRRQEIRQARDALVEAVRALLPDWEFTTPPGGLCLWLRLPQPHAEHVVTAAEREGLLVPSGTRFAVTGSLDHWIRIPYVLPPEQLREAVARLQRAHHRASDGHRPQTTTGPARPPLIA